MPLAREAVAIRRQLQGGHPDLANSLAWLGAVLEAQGDYASALPVLEESLHIYRRVSGDEDPRVAGALGRLAALLMYQGQFEAARPLAEECLAIYRRTLGGLHPEVAQALNNLAHMDMQRGDLAAARARLEESLDIYRATRGDEHPDVAYNLNNLAQLSQSEGDLSAARDLFEESLAIYRATVGEDHPEFAGTQNNLAVVLVDQGDYEGALPLYESSLAIRRRLFGNDHPHVANSLNNLAGLHQQRGDYAAALALSEEGLDLYRRVLGDRHPIVAKTLGNVALLHSERGEYSTARALLEESLSIRREALGENHPAVADGLGSLAALLRRQGHYGAAGPLYEQSLDIQRRTFGEDHPSIAVTLNNLAFLLQARGDYEAARPMFETALDMNRRIFGDEHASVATSLANLGGLLYVHGDYASALDKFRQSLEIERNEFGEGHPRVANSLNNIALALKAGGDVSAALSLFQQSLEIRRRTLGETHPEVALTLNNVAGVLEELGDETGAGERYEKSLTLYRNALGDHHPDVARGLSNLAGFHARRGDRSAARPLLDESLNILEGRLELLDALSDREGAAYLADSTDVLRAWLHAFDTLEDTPAAWSRVLQWKGAGTRRLFERTRRIRTSRDPSARAALDRLAETRRALSKLVFDPQERGDAEDRRQQITELTRDKEAQERALAKIGGAEPLTAPTPDAVCSALPEDVLLVDFYRAAASYEVFIVEPNCRITRLTLDNAAELDAEVEHWRTLLASGAQTSARASFAATIVGDAIWPVLADHARGRRAVWFVPDGALSALPWAALPIGHGKLLVEDHESLVLPRADVLTVREEPSGDGLLTVSSVDYGPTDHPPAPCLDETWRPLSASADEAEGVVAVWKRKRRREPVLSLSATDASEHAVREAAPGNRVLHLATHGFFADDLCSSSAGDPRGVGVNPMLLSGVVLANANVPRDPLADDDGFLTAEEVAGIDLRGVELALLSACETGRGALRAGEGVIGLQRAFTIAGAKSVVMSLWSVPDTATAVLMQDVVRQNLRGRSPATALRAAQLKALREHRETHGTDGATRWAAWLVSGRGR